MVWALWGLGFEVWHLGFKVLGLGFEVSGQNLETQSADWGLGFEVGTWASWFWVWASRFRAKTSRPNPPTPGGRPSSAPLKLPLGRPTKREPCAITLTGKNGAGAF